ncbi:PE domain-containing protein [Nocardia sp. NPDC049220]|uniref:PE domain-containing protein n=1 Tax=Nocardia sp. NPDC049220 TaxID=3155273 RepID=UPI0033EA06CE
MEFDPIRARKSAADLDALAARLDADLRGSLPALAVESAGLDEVSGRTAETMRDVASSYGESATAGVLEIRKLAAALRSHTDVLLQMEDDSAADFGRS